jgi:hypothetical protein
MARQPTTDRPDGVSSGVNTDRETSLTHALGKQLDDGTLLPRRTGSTDQTLRQRHHIVNHVDNHGDP